MPRKPSPKQDTITQHLRSQIITGTLAPGMRLPTRAELEGRFAVSSVTVQRALDVLSEHGFISARGTLGTFVSERPPHASTYAVVFFAHPQGEGWLRFYTALLSACTVLATESGHQLEPFFCSSDAAGEREHHRLQRVLAAQAVAGIIFTSHPYPLAPSSVLSMPNVARVALMPGSDYPEMSRVSYDEADFLAQAIEWFARQRRRQVALLTVPSQFAPAQIDTQIARHGLSSPAHWRQTVHPTQSPSARACAHLLLHDGQRQRPDALLISDDNLIEPALLGLADAGVRIGTDVEVVAHANFPAPALSNIGIRRLGYDARTTLATCVAIIDAQRRGGERATRTTVLPVFADTGSTVDA